MTDIGKHVFEVTSFGMVWYRGCVTAETDKTWTVRLEDNHRPRRVLKSANAVAAQDFKAGGRAEAEHKAHEAHCRSLESAVREARKAQREAVLAVLSGESSP